MCWIPDTALSLYRTCGRPSVPRSLSVPGGGGGLGEGAFNMERSGVEGRGFFGLRNERSVGKEAVHYILSSTMR